MKVAFLRGINVGGRNRLAMKDLRTLLEELGAVNARTHLQSGNAVFSAPGDEARFADRLGATIEEALGVEATARNWRTVTRVLAMTRHGTGPA